jgi:hypothetical protein
VTTDRFSVLVSVVLRNAPLKIAVDTASTVPPPSINSMMVSFVASGNKNDAVRIVNRIPILTSFGDSRFK